MQIKDLIGRQIGRYQIKQLLGRGGMAAVYEAYDTVLERPVALKLLYPQYLIDEGLVARFRREAVTVARLEHPNIVPIYDVGETDGYSYIAMKLLPGNTLQDMLSAGKTLSTEETLTLTQQIASALDYAHDAGIIHRDIKPGNIMFDGSGRPILTDFGIAKSLDSPGLTTSGVIVGTPDYMAPEQIDQQLAPIDRRTDIYALGVLVYRMLTGKQPFSGTSSQVLLGHLQRPAPPPSAYNPKLPTALDSVIGRALAKYPDDRYPTAGAFAAGLAEAAGDSTMASAAPIPPPQAVRRAKERPVVEVASAEAVVNYQRPIPAAQSAMPVKPRPSTMLPLISLLVVLLMLVGGGWYFLGRNDDGADKLERVSAAENTSTPKPTSADPATATDRPTATSAPTDTATPSTTPTDTPTKTPQPSATRQPAAGGEGPKQRVEPTPRPVETKAPPPPPTATPEPPPPPTETPRPEPTPCQAPLSGGFGLLWQTNAGVRNTLGCPTAAEEGGNAVIQYYPGGVMYWWENSDITYVMIGGTNGRWLALDARQYRDDPLPYECTSGFTPVRGFARVLAARPDIAADLGRCADTPEENGGGAFQRFIGGRALFMPVTASIGEQRIWVLSVDGSFQRYRDPNQ